MVPHCASPSAVTPNEKLKMERGISFKAIQKRALEEGLPYQTLISSLLHKYVSGRLVEKERLTKR